MKILIIGASGYLGSGLFDLFIKTKNEIYGTYYKNIINQPNFMKLDITKKKDVILLINRIRPDIVILCSGIIDDYTETHKNIKQVNYKGTKNVVDVCSKTKSHLIYLSSAAVFDKFSGFFYENSRPFSNSVYGKSKIYGEKLVKRVNGNLILRCSLIIGKAIVSNHRFYGKFINALKKKTSLSLDADWKFKPAMISHIFDVINWWMNVDKYTSSIIHVKADVITSKYKIAKKIIKKLNIKLPIKKLNNKEYPNIYLETKYSNINGFPKIKLIDGLNKIIRDEELLSS